MSNISDIPNSPTAHTAGGAFIWTDAAVALLGTAHDHVVADQLGIKKGVVWRERNARGIGTVFENTVWTDEAIALLGTMSDLKLAKMLGVSKQNVLGKRAQRNVPPSRPPRVPFELPAEYLDKLGKISDGKIAKALGVSQPTICNYRRKLGISATTQFVFPSEELNGLLGKDTDANLGRRFGVTEACVWLRRKKAGIPPFSKTSKNPAPPLVSKPPAE